MDYTVTELFEHIIIKGDSWTLLTLPRGRRIGTKSEFDVYLDRDEAIAAMQAHDPDYEAEPWEFDFEGRIAELKEKLKETDYVALTDYDKDKPEVKAQRQLWRDEIRDLEDYTTES